MPARPRAGYSARVRALAFVLLFVSISLPALAQDVWTDPHPGIRYLHRSTAEPKEIHALLIDLRRPEITLRSTRESERGTTPSAFGRTVGAVAVVNGDFYNTNGSFDPVGLAIGEGMVWSPDTAGQRFIACTAAKACEIDTTNQARQAHASWHSAVGGNTLLVNGGQVVQSAADDTSCGAFCTTQHPRTAVGLSADRNTLILVVVEGRQTPILGMTTNRLARLMLELGADVALNLDGGGSSSMVVDGRRVSGRPSNEPNERPVANHIAVLFDAAAATTGRLVGFIRENDVFDASAGLSGAAVSLSTGERTTTDSRGFYEFLEVAPADVTVTAELAGFTPASEVKTVVAGATNWKSMALVRVPPVMADAGAQEDAAAPPDAAPAPDAAPEQDAGSLPDAEEPALDAGFTEDAAAVSGPDAAAPNADAGVLVEVDGEEGGCRCVGRPEALAAWPLLAGLFLLSLRRRR